MIIYKKNNKNILINKKGINALQESVSKIVYHFTSVGSCLKIVKNNTIFLQSSMAGDADNMGSKELFYLSTTRQRNVNFGYSYKFKDGGARIELDGDKFNNNFRGKPIDYWGDSMGKQSYYRKGNSDFSSKQHHIDAESEDRIFSRNQAIYNASDYIRRIDIICDNKNDLQTDYVIHILYNAGRNFYNKIFVYDNINDFNKQSENTINSELLHSERAMELLYHTPTDSITKKNYNDEIVQILQVIFAGEVDVKNYDMEAAKILKKYGLEKYITKKLFSDLRNGYYSFQNLVSILKDKLYTFSRHPNEEGSKILKIFTDYLYNHNIKTYRELIKYKSQFSVVSDYDVDRMIDSNKIIRFLTYENHSFSKILIPNPDSTSFWLIIDDREYFLNKIYYSNSLKHGSKDDESFYKYLQHIIKNDISVSKMLNILNKVITDKEELREILDFGEFKYEDLDVYRAMGYRLPQYANERNFYGSKNYYNNMNKIKMMYSK